MLEVGVYGKEGTGEVSVSGKWCAGGVVEVAVVSKKVEVCQPEVETRVRRASQCEEHGRAATKLRGVWS